MLKIKPFAGLGTLIILGSLINVKPSHAASFAFEFTFDVGQASGQIFGLEEGISSASTIILDPSPLANLGQPITFQLDPLGTGVTEIDNTFTVGELNGELTILEAEFQATVAAGQGGCVDEMGFGFCRGIISASPGSGFGNVFGDRIGANNSSGIFFGFDPITSTPEAIPEPLTILGSLSAIVMGTFLKKRAKKSSLRKFDDYSVSN